MLFPWEILSEDDWKIAVSILGKPREPDLVIAPDGDPYIYRWYVIPHNHDANVYFHVQVASDPERPLHDHPWDNMSVILAGGYDELVVPSHQLRYWAEDECDIRQLRKGSVVSRVAEEAHRLLLPKEFPYTMTLFSTGPKVREWGFWYPNGWRSFKEVTVQLPDGRSIHKGV